MPLAKGIFVGDLIIPVRTVSQILPAVIGEKFLSRQHFRPAPHGFDVTFRGGGEMHHARLWPLGRDQDTPAWCPCTVDRGRSSIPQDVDGLDLLPHHGTQASTRHAVYDA